MRLNPVFNETCVGLVKPSQAQLDFLLYLFVLSMGVFIWWPRHSVLETMLHHDPPNTLLVAVLLCGAIIAYYSLRAGAEEIFLHGQHGLQDWTVGTSLPLMSILRGYINAQLLQSVHLLALSSPLVLITFNVSGGQWAALMWCMGMIVAQALFYRLAAAAIYLAIGRHGALTVISTRALLVGVYLLTTIVVPIASPLTLSIDLFNTNAANDRFDLFSGPIVFMMIYAALSALMMIIVQQQLTQLRRQSLPEPE